MAASKRANEDPTVTPITNVEKPEQKKNEVPG